MNRTLLNLSGLLGFSSIILFQRKTYKEKEKSLNSELNKRKEANNILERKVDLLSGEITSNRNKISKIGEALVEVEFEKNNGLNNGTAVGNTNRIINKKPNKIYGSIRFEFVKTLFKYKSPPPIVTQKDGFRARQQLIISSCDEWGATTICRYRVEGREYTFNKGDYYLFGDKPGWQLLSRRKIAVADIDKYIGKQITVCTKWGLLRSGKCGGAFFVENDTISTVKEDTRIFRVESFPFFRIVTMDMHAQVYLIGYHICDSLIKIKEAIALRRISGGDYVSFPYRDMKHCVLLSGSGSYFPVFEIRTKNKNEKFYIQEEHI